MRDVACAKACRIGSTMSSTGIWISPYQDQVGLVGPLISLLSTAESVLFQRCMYVSRQQDFVSLCVGLDGIEIGRVGDWNASKDFNLQFSTSKLN